MAPVAAASGWWVGLHVSHTAEMCRSQNSESAIVCNFDQRSASLSATGQKYWICCQSAYAVSTL